MRIIYTPDHVQHNPPHEIYDGVLAGYAESADRALAIADTLSRRGAKLELPREFPDDDLLRLHHPQYVRFLKQRSAGLKNEATLYPSYFMTDTYAPIVNGTYPAARQAVDVALTGAQIVLADGGPVYALCRPPGHHAEAVSMGGYCYFNNGAIAADHLSRHGRVAILDIDFHHGNGTQRFFYDRSDVLYVSIHGDPDRVYPYASGFATETGRGEGAGYTANYPLPAGTDDTAYEQAFSKALTNVRNFAPDYLIVSAGFDGYEHDPICDFKLTPAFYNSVGRSIAELGLPSLIIQEGGYNVEALGELAYEFLSGIEPGFEATTK